MGREFWFLKNRKNLGEARVFLQIPTANGVKYGAIWSMNARSLLDSY
jgi:hypothetical protein